MDETHRTPSLTRSTAIQSSSPLLAVVVLYRQAPADSVTVQTLARALDAPDAPTCRVVLYDNTPAAERKHGAIPRDFHYVPAESNRGMLGAYEAALTAAEAEGAAWMLTLDQDTALPETFLAALAPGLAAAAANPCIGAIVPHLAEGTRLLSPAYVNIGRARPLPAGFDGTPTREARAFNSAALLRVAAVRSLGGFEPGFWLDHFDSWLHHELYVRGWRMHVLGGLTLEHHFSLLDYGNRVSLDHYKNFLAAESAYNDLYESWFARVAYTAQMGVRLLNQLRRRESREILEATRQAWRRRLTMSRQARLERWRAAATVRMAANSKVDVAG